MFTSSVMAQITPFVEGVYHFCDATVTANTNLTGSWSVSGDADEYCYLQAEDTAVMDFEAIGSWLVIWRATGPVESNYDLLELCVNESCRNVSNLSTDLIAHVPLIAALDEETNIIEITSTGISQLEYMMILDGAIEASIEPEATPEVLNILLPPEPQKQFEQVGESIYVYDRSLTVGDMLNAAIGLSIFIMLSLLFVKSWGAHND